MLIVVYKKHTLFFLKAPDTWRPSMSTNPIYRAYRVRQTPFFENKSTYNYHTGSYSSVPGFFTPFNSLSDISNQLKAPFAIPIIAFAQALKCAINALTYGLLSVLNIPFLNLHQSFYCTCEAVKAFVDIFVNAINIVTDTLFQIIALVTRIGATVFAAANAGFQCIKNRFSSEVNDSLTSTESTYIDLVNTDGYEKKHDVALPLSLGNSNDDGRYTV